MEAYLDNSSTTRCSKAALDKMIKVYTEDYGNPSSMHTKGVEAEDYVIEAKDAIARTLRVKPAEIYFTSGGTESNNLAVIGAALANKRKGMHVVTSSYEHPSVANPVHALEDMGFSVTYLPSDSSGAISPDHLRDAIREDTVLVTLMHVNNEIGSVTPIEEFGPIIKQANPSTLFHVDAIQSYGKFEIRPTRAKIDMLSVSGHKIHGPKGVGFLYVREGTKISPLLYGGGQQDGLRSGTENVPGIAGLGVAASAAYEDIEADRHRLFDLKKRFADGVSGIEGVTFNGPELAAGAPHILSVSVENVRAEVLLHSLEEKGVYVSAGSACSTHKRAASATLTAIGTRASLLESTVRVSFSVTNTPEEIDYAAECFGELIPMLSAFTRK
ncbi:MAG: cysteine desulfurase [Eubacterium sp.]|nr:cysteine desulfurase [Eubacterium sp.]